MNTRFAGSGAAKCCKIIDFENCKIDLNFSEESTEKIIITEIPRLVGWLAGARDNK